MKKVKLRIVDNDQENDIYVNSGIIYCDGQEIKFSDYPNSIDEPVTSLSLTKKLEDYDDIRISLLAEYSISDIEYVKSMYSQIVCNNPSEEEIKNIEVDPRRLRSTSNLLGEHVDLDFISFENSITIDLLNDEEYTGIVNLSDIQGTYGIAEVCIKYSIGNLIYSYNTMIDVFGGNVIEEIEDLIILEYINKVLHVYPKSENIGECIISNCRISYGNRI